MLKVEFQGLQGLMTYSQGFRKIIKSKDGDHIAQENEHIPPSILIYIISENQ